MGLIKIEGVVQGLSRTSETYRREGHAAPLTVYLATFTLGEHQVKLSFSEPVPFSDGDRVRVVGYEKPHHFVGEACHDLASGWTSPSLPPMLHLITAGVAFLLGPILGLGIKALASPQLFLLGPLTMTVVAILIFVQGRARSKAHRMVLHA